MTQPDTLPQQEKIEGLSDHSGMAVLEDLTSPQEPSFFKDRTSHQAQLIENIGEVLERGKGLAIEGALRTASVGIGLFDLEAKHAMAISQAYLNLVKTHNIPTRYIISFSISTVVSTICGASIYVGTVTGKTLFDPYTSLFWLIGGLGIALMSLKGIFTWKSE